jgi:hypothetical protein
LFAAGLVGIAPRDGIGGKFHREEV